MGARELDRRMWLAAAACALVAVLLGRFAENLARERSWTRAEDALRVQARLVEDGLAADLDFVETQELQRRAEALGRSSGTRITLIRADGSVAADSDAHPSAMDNLATRPEVVDALHAEFGLCRRWSPAMRVHSLFVARALRRGNEHVGWVRVSVVAEEAAEPIGARTWILVGGAAAFAFAALGCAGRALRARAP